MNLSELARMVGAQPVSLFLGAGSSVSAGGPNGELLLNAIKLRYNLKEGFPFFTMMEMIIGHDQAARREIEDFIQSILITISPTDDHKYLLSLPWNAVVTTNYDDLPEKVGLSIDGKRYLKGISSLDDDVNTERPDLLYCFKLFGDAKIRYPKKGRMILTEADRRREYMIQAKFYKLFYDLVTSGSMIYLGYSFRDELVFDIIEDMREELREFPWQGYTILPSQPPAEIEKRLSAIGIKWVQGTLQEFVEESKKFHSRIPNSSHLRINPMLVHGIPISIDRAIETNIIQKFTYLNQSQFRSNSKPHDFITGADKSFTPYAEQWDFPRKFKMSFRNAQDAKGFFDSKDFIQSRLELDGSQNSLFALTGAAGSGKTVAARRIAFDWYNSGNPVIFLDSNLSVDRIALKDLLDNVYSKYISLAVEGTAGSPKPVRFLLVAENSRFLLRELADLQNYMKNDGKSLDILVVERKNALSASRAKELGFAAIFEVDDTISDADKDEFFKHFNRFRLIDDKPTFMATSRDASINSSFFALLYTSVKKTRENLQNSVIREYNDLAIDAQRVYAVVSLLHAFDQSPYLSLVAQATGISSLSIIEMIERGSLNQLLFYEPEDDQTLRASHRIIAEIVSAESFPTSEALCQIIEKIIRSISPNNVRGLNILHDLLINRIHETYLFNEQLRYQQKVSLFKTALTYVMETSALLHHLARLHMFGDDFKLCRTTLLRAKDCKEQHHRDSITNIKDSEGRLELAEARRAKNDNNLALAREYLFKAEDIFAEAQRYLIDHPHSYEGRAETYYEMALIAESPIDRQELLMRCLAICSSCKEFFADLSTTSFRQLETRALKELFVLGFNKEDAIKLAVNLKNADGFALIAEMEKDDNLSDALRLVNEGLTYDKRSIWLNSLRYQFIRMHDPDNLDRIGKVLEDWKSNCDPAYHTIVNFELAKFKFILGCEVEAYELFEQLSSESHRIPDRFVKVNNRDIWYARRSPKECIGELIKIPSFNSQGVIRSRTPSFQREIPVPYSSMRFMAETKQDVRFFIAFSINGPFAIDVRSMA